MKLYSGALLIVASLTLAANEPCGSSVSCRAKCKGGEFNTVTNKDTGSSAFVCEVGLQDADPQGNAGPKPGQGPKPVQKDYYITRCEPRGIPIKRIVLDPLTAAACKDQGGTLCGKTYCTLNGGAKAVDEFDSKCQREALLKEGSQFDGVVRAGEPIAATSEEADALCAGKLAN